MGGKTIMRGLVIASILAVMTTSTISPALAGWGCAAANSKAGNGSRAGAVGYGGPTQEAAAKVAMDACRQNAQTKGTGSCAVQFCAQNIDTLEAMNAEVCKYAAAHGDVLPACQH
jgi:hypothetical protein